MMTKTSTRTVRTGSYETDYMFPITRAAYAIDGDTITVRYTIDNCD